MSISAVVDVLRFDVAELQRNFNLHGVKTGAAWVLAFVPRDGALAEDFTALVVSGEHETLAKIEFFKSPGQHIDIFISGARKNVSFSDGDLAHYFR